MLSLEIRIIKGTEVVKGRGGSLQGWRGDEAAKEGGGARGQEDVAAAGEPDEGSGCADMDMAEDLVRHVL